MDATAAARITGRSEAACNPLRQSRAPTASSIEDSSSVQPDGDASQPGSDHIRVKCDSATPSRCYERQRACSAGYELLAPLTVDFVDTGRYGVGSRRRASRLMKPPELTPSLRTAVHDRSARFRGESQAVPVGKWRGRGQGLRTIGSRERRDPCACFRRCGRVPATHLVEAYSRSIQKSDNGYLFDVRVDVGGVVRAPVARESARGDASSRVLRLKIRAT